MLARIRTRDAGFTLIEIVIAVAIVGIFAAVLSPMVFRHLEDAKISKAASEAEILGTAILSYYKDVGKWPYTDLNGPSGNGIDRLLTFTQVPTGKGDDPGEGAQKWGNFGKTKQLGDYLFSNNPDDDTGSGATGQKDEDWATSGQGAWRGPYIEKYEFHDPWHNSYVVNSRYFPGGKYKGDVIHKVMVLSAGPDGKWSTSFNDATSEAIAGDDIGYVVTVQ